MWWKEKRKWKKEIGDYMANPQNLVPNSKRTPSELREMTSKGGKKSGQVRAFAKTFREKINDNLTNEDLDEIISELIKEAKEGNIRAIELLRDTRGEKPVEQVQNINPPIIQLERPKE